MNKLINIVLSGLLWRQYKFLIASLAVLIIVIFLVGQAHDDYIAYANTTNEEVNVGLSFVIKWLIWIIAFIIFLGSNHMANARKEKLKAQTPSRSLKNILLFRANNVSPPKNKKTPANDEHLTVDEQTSEDPFDHLRKKDKLRSFAEVLIDKHEKK